MQVEEDASRLGRWSRSARWRSFRSPRRAAAAATRSPRRPTARRRSASRPLDIRRSRATRPAIPRSSRPRDTRRSHKGILNGLQGALGGQTVTPGGIGDLTDVGLKAQAFRLAPGMQPEGDQLKQNMTEGQHVVMLVTMQAGKCYTVVGFSPLGAVKNLDLNLLTLVNTLAGQDLTHNNTPVIGGAPSPMCPVLMFPLQYRLDV